MTLFSLGDVLNLRPQRNDRHIKRDGMLWRDYSNFAHNPQIGLPSLECMEALREGQAQDVEPADAGCQTEDLRMHLLMIQLVCITIIRKHSIIIIITTITTGYHYRLQLRIIVPSPHITFSIS